MFKYCLTIILIGAIQSTFAQSNEPLFIEDYSSTLGWKQINGSVTIQDGKVRAVNAQASGIQSRIFKKLDRTISPSHHWRLETDFIVHRPSWGNPLFDIVALTNTDKDVRMECFTPQVMCCAGFNPDCPKGEIPIKSFFIYVSTPLSQTTTDQFLMGFGIGNSINGFGPKNALSLDYEQHYYSVFTKVDSTYTLHVYLLPDTTSEVVNSPLVVISDSLIPSYNYVQHGVNTGGGGSRNSSVEVDNTTVRLLNEIAEEEDSALIVYNFVTANLDGKNDYFYIQGLSTLEEYELLIFNRYGNVIFQSKDYNNDWNGKNLEPGTYFYKFKYHDKEINDVLFLSK